MKWQKLLVFLITYILFSVGCGRLWLSTGQSSSSSSASGLSVPIIPMFVQKTTGTGSGVTSFSGGLAKTASIGDLIVIVCGANTTTTAISVSDNVGNTYNALGVGTRALVGKTSMFYAINTSTAPIRLTCTLAPADTGSFRADVYSGIDPISPIDDFNVTTGTSTAPTVALTTTRANSLIVSNLSTDGSVVTTFSDLRLLQRSNTVDEDGAITATGVYTVTPGFNVAGPWINNAAAFKAATGTTIMKAAHYMAGGMIIGGTTQRTSSVLRTEDEGLNWSVVGQLPAVRDSGCLQYFNDALFYIGGWSGAVASSAVYKSLDGGGTWTTIGNIPAPRESQGCAVYNNKLWVVAGSNNYTVGGSQTNVYSSPDGVTWTSVGNVPTALTNVYNLNVFNGKMWLMGGTNTAANNVNAVRWTTDGVTWSTVGTTVLPAIRAGGMVAVFNSLMWYIGGFNGGDVTTVWSCGDPCGGWTVNTPLPTAISSSGAIATNNGHLIQMGMTAGASAYDTGYISDGTSNWGTRSVFYSPRNYNTFASNTGGTPYTSIDFMQLKEANATANTNSIATGAFTEKVVKGNLIICRIYYNSGAETVQNVTDSVGNAYFIAAGPTAGAGGLNNWKQEIWYAPNITGSGNINVTATMTNTFNAAKAISCHEYTGAAVSPLGNSVSNMGNSAVPSSGPIATTANNEMIFSAAIFGANGFAAYGRLRSSQQSNVTQDVFARTQGIFNPVVTTPAADDFVMQAVTFKAR